MSNMIQKVGGVQNEKAVKKIKSEHLFGVEFDKEIFALACANMLIHKDGKTNITQDDSRTENVGNGIVVNIKDGDGISEIFNGKCLTVDMFGKTYYQENNFYAVSHGHVNILLPKFEINKEIGLFFCSILNKLLAEKYSFSVMCIKSKIKEEKIFLPTSNDRTPDWVYITNFIGNLYIPIKKCVAG